jgi:hypothetical protein
MKVSELLAKRTTFSFEFYPAKTPQASEELYQTIRELVPLEPSYVSVTYGAGGSTRELTHDLVLRIHARPLSLWCRYLTCVNSTRAEIHRILERYQENGIENVMPAWRPAQRRAQVYPRRGRGFHTPPTWCVSSIRNFPTSVCAWPIPRRTPRNPQPRQGAGFISKPSR